MCLHRPWQGSEALPLLITELKLEHEPSITALGGKTLEGVLSSCGTWWKVQASVAQANRAALGQWGNSVCN